MPMGAPTTHQPVVQGRTDEELAARAMMDEISAQAEALMKKYKDDPSGLATELIPNPAEKGDFLSNWERSQIAYRVLDRYADKGGLAAALATKLTDDRVKALVPTHSSLLMSFAMALQKQAFRADAERISGHLVDPAHGHLFAEGATQSPAVTASLERHGAALQSVGGGVGPTVFDEYWIVIETMPPLLTPEAYLAEMATDLNTAVNDETFDKINVFKRITEDQKRGAPAVGDVYDINIYGPDNGAVMLVEQTRSHFVFQTVTTDATGSHPEYGSREFGFEMQKDSSVRWYTRGVSRPGSVVAAAIGAPLQKEGWTALLKGIANSLQSRGGKQRSGSFGHWIRRL
jgi:hypothetical protein